MDTFNQIAVTLIQQGVICTWSNKTLFLELQKGDMSLKINQWLKPIDLKLASSHSGQAYYAVRNSINSTVKEEAKSLFRGLMKSTRFNIQFIELLTKTLHVDFSISAGEEIHYSDILSAIGANSAHQRELEFLDTSDPSADYQQNLDKLIARLIRDQLLIEADKKQKIYQFTGKLDLVQDILIFIQESEAIPVDDDEVDTQESLL